MVSLRRTHQLANIRFTRIRVTKSQAEVYTLHLIFQLTFFPIDTILREIHPSKKLSIVKLDSKQLAGKLWLCLSEADIATTHSLPQFIVKRILSQESTLLLFDVYKSLFGAALVSLCFFLYFCSPYG